jgi:glycosyltransferase involved in cell wall biosynthesis
MTVIHPLDVSSPTAVGGIETWIHDFLKFSSKDYRVLGCSRTKAEPSLSFRGGVEVFGVSKLPERRKYLPDIVRFGWALICNRSLISGDVILHRIDLVPLIRLLSPKSKIHLFIHTDLSEQTKRNSDSFWRFLPIIYFALEKYAFEQVAKIGVYSKTDFARISKIAPGATLLQSWYNENIFEFSRRQRNVDVLWAGRFERVKDPLLAVNVLSHLAAELPNLKAVFAGSGALFEASKSRCEELGLNGVIKFAGPLTQNDLAKLMQDSKVFLQTSHFEGSPRILLEALGSGCNLVTTMAGDPDNLVQGLLASFQASSRRPESISQFLLKALASEGPRTLDSKIEARASKNVVPTLERTLFG